MESALWMAPAESNGAGAGGTGAGGPVQDPPEAHSTEERVYRLRMKA